MGHTEIRDRYAVSIRSHHSRVSAERVHMSESRQPERDKLVSERDIDDRSYHSRGHLELMVKTSKLADGTVQSELTILADRAWAALTAEEQRILTLDLDLPCNKWYVHNTFKIQEYSQRKNVKHNPWELSSRDIASLPSTKFTMKGKETIKQFLHKLHMKMMFINAHPYVFLKSLIEGRFCDDEEEAEVLTAVTLDGNSRVTLPPLLKIMQINDSSNPKQTYDSIYYLY